MGNLSETSVFFDFDGTISVSDIGAHVLDRLADARWRAFEVEYDDGRMGSRDCLAEQWRCIPDNITEAQRRAVAREVPLDPGFGPLVVSLRAAGAEVAVVSDGYGYYVHDLLAEWDLPIYTNAIDFATNTVLFPYANDACPACAACGTCKPLFLQAARELGRRSIFIGDGTSDRHAARVADVVFAKGALARWCGDEGITHVAFDHLDEVTARLAP